MLLWKSESLSLPENKMTKITIGVAGAGAMGSGIAQVAASAGHQVILYDTQQQTIGNALSMIKTSLQKLAAKGRLKESADEVLERIKPAQKLNEFAGTAFFIEAVIENLAIKKSLLSEVQRVTGTNCILASNTSSLSIAALSSGCPHPSRVLGTHFFNPPVLMKLVEIIPGIRTEESVLHESTGLIRSWDKLTVQAKDTPGFIVNRIARPFYGEAIRILEEGIASASTIDHAMKSLAGFKMGPFELMDFIGNDVNYTVTETVWKQLFYDPRYKPSQTQRRLAEAGMLGYKTGEGFYKYVDQTAVVPPPSDNIQLLRKIVLRILVMLINEAADALYLRIASKDDIEIAMTSGVNYPKGLLKWADEIGIDKVVDELLKLKEWYNEERYRPSVLLRKMAESNKTFFN